MASQVFQLSKADWASRAEEVALPFYEKVLDKVVAGQQAVTTEQLSRIRADIGINDVRAKDMHSVTYEQVARGLLAPERGAGATVDAAAQAKLAETRALLELSEEATYAALLVLASPLFSASVGETLAAAEAAEAMDEATAAQLAGSIAQRASELQLSAESSKALQATPRVRGRRPGHPSLPISGAAAAPRSQYNTLVRNTTLGASVASSDPQPSHPSSPPPPPSSSSSSATAG